MDYSQHYLIGYTIGTFFKHSGGTKYRKKQSYKLPKK